MKGKSILVATTTGLLLLASTSGFAETKLDNDKNKFSYAVGTMLGSQLRQQFQQNPDELNSDVMLEALGAAFLDKELKMTQEEVQTTLKAAEDRHKVTQDKVNEETKAKGAAWLEANKNKPGVKVTDSGLQYKVITEGTGKQPTAEDTVEVHYKGTLIDGTEFDSSYKRGQPASFPVKGVIKGWTEALQLMKEGGKMELTIPSDLAYGERGAGANIGPHSTLIFEVELIKVK